MMHSIKINNSKKAGESLSNLLGRWGVNLKKLIVFTLFQMYRNTGKISNEKHDKG